MKIVPRKKARRLNELALFAGAGGGVLASRLLGWRTVCAVEIDPYCREVLLRRQEEGHLEPFPIWDDVRSFDGEPWCGIVDVISAGFPCQPFSVAGKRAGADDERNLWPETIRIIREVEPRFAFLENVPGLLNPIQDKESGETQASYFGTILRDLAESGYDARWCMLSAAEMGAPHRRNRLWIRAEQRGVMANSSTRRSDTQEEELLTRRDATRISNPDVADTKSKRKYRILGGSSSQKDKDWECTNKSNSRGIQTDIPDASSSDVTRRNRKRRQEQMQSRGSDWWSAEPSVGRMAHGVAYRVDRIKALGNGQVPAVARAAWELLTR